MKHVFFALFESNAGAVTAIGQARQAGLLDAHASAQVHEGPLHEEDLGFIDSDAREGLLGGAVTGGIVGAAATSIAGLALGPANLLLLLVTATLGLVAGAVMGGMLSGIVGSSVPDRVLEGWDDALRHGRVAVTVTADRRQRERALERLMRHYGALEARKPLA